METEFWTTHPVMRKAIEALADIEYSSEEFNPDALQSIYQASSALEELNK